MRVAAAQLDTARLRQVFTARVLASLCRLVERGRLQLAGRAARLDDGRRFGRWIEQLAQLRWVLIRRAPLADPERTLGYLAGYAQRVAISDRRIVAIDARAGTVTFTYRQNNAGPGGEDVTAEATLDGVEFLRRFLEHVMPKRFGRVRFYGWWSTGRKGRELPRIRAALGVELPEAAPEESEQEQEEKSIEVSADAPVRRRCPRCGQQTLERVLEIPAPPLYQLMRVVIWPVQRRWRAGRQQALAGLEPWLSGSAALPASGFT